MWPNQKAVLRFDIFNRRSLEERNEGGGGGGFKFLLLDRLPKALIQLGFFVVNTPFDAN